MSGVIVSTFGNTVMSHESDGAAMSYSRERENASLTFLLGIKKLDTMKKSFDMKNILLAKYWAASISI